MTGQTFNRLTVLERDRIEKVKGGTLHFWKCRCICGNEVVVRAGKLRSGHTQSCGCYQRERAKQARTVHGHSPRNGKPTGIYESWRAMKERCSNPKHIGWKYYGGRGITVDSRWKDFSEFLKDMESTWFDGATIERKEVNGNYDKDNCCWIPMSQQHINRRPQESIHGFLKMPKSP